MLACWIDNPDGDYFKKHLAIIPDYMWVAEDGMKMQVTKGVKIRFFWYILSSDGNVFNVVDLRRALEVNYGIQGLRFKLYLLVISLMKLAMFSRKDMIILSYLRFDILLVIILYLEFL